MKIHNFSVGIAFLLAFSSCSDFLEEKPDIKMVVPKSLDDAEFLLNDYTTMNTAYPVYGEWSTDQYDVSSETFDGVMNLDQRNAYTWTDQPYNDVLQWQRPYKVVYNANQALDIISKLGAESATEKAKNIVGIAHFFRAFAFQQVVEVFAAAYQQQTASAEMGIPLRLDPAIDVPSTRASLKQSYEQIVSDYKMAAGRLPLNEAIKGRPFRASAYAGLARAYLYMGDYQQAYQYADSSLQTHRELMDFNTLKATDNLPIPKFNVEVLFAAVSANAGPMSLNNGLVDSVLYKSYRSNDLRKGIFFKKNSYPENSYGFKGNYDKANNNLFVGLTTSEMYLIKAESAVRIGKISEALLAVNTLLQKRQDKNNYIPITETNPDILLPLLLQERQKELLFRGRRWSDLKRLNLDSRFQKNLIKIVKGVTYTLPHDSRKYAFRLPEPVVSVGKIPQNNR
jgi:tetratricopeptide (TPR) repeat protein